MKEGTSHVRGEKIRHLLKGLKDSMERFFITYIYLFFATGILLYSIFDDEWKGSYFLSVLLAVFVSALCQVTFERFFSRKWIRFVLQGASVLTLVVSLLLLPADHQINLIQGSRSVIFLAAVFFLFLLIPVLAHKNKFHDNFLIAFQGLFQALFYTGILFLGLALILAAIDNLIVPIDSKWYPSAAAIIFVFLAPWLFLSRFPIYGKATDSLEEVEIINQIPKFFERLICFILLPLTAVYMVILILYILLNLSGEFWTNNLLEPLLISFSSVVIVLYLLSAQIEHVIVRLFRLIFPKVLLVIVSFQLFASIRMIDSKGLNHNRYFVILFALFALASGVIMSFSTYKRSNLIGGCLVVVLLIAMIPPIDAFTVSGWWQKQQLEAVLLENDMLQDGEIKQNLNLSEVDKSKITRGIFYLHEIDKLAELEYLPDDFYLYGDFETLFGFASYEQTYESSSSINVYHRFTEPLVISGYDIFFQAWSNEDKIDFYFPNGIQIQNETYYLTQNNEGSYHSLILQDHEMQEILSFDLEELFTRFEKLDMEYGELTDEEATFVVENSQAEIKIVVQDASINEYLNTTNTYAQFYVFVRIK